MVEEFISTAIIWSTCIFMLAKLKHILTKNQEEHLILNLSE